MGDNDEGYSDQREGVDDFDAFEFFQEHFRQDQAHRLVESAIIRSEAALLKVLRELQYADSAFTTAETRTEGTGANDYTVAFVRAYRAIDWFQNELHVGIAEAFLEPFRVYFDAEAPPNLRHLLNPGFVRKLRKRVLETMRGEGERLEQLITTFFGRTSAMRQRVIHGLATPTSDECRDCIDSAAAVYNHADEMRHPVARAEFRRQLDRP